MAFSKIIKIMIKLKKEGLEMQRRAFIVGSVWLLAGSVLPVRARMIEADVPRVPGRGSRERKAILDAFRKWVKNNLHLDVIFVVNYIKTKNGWAWIQVTPQSSDGKNHYEDLAALLRRGDGCWAVVAVPSSECASADDPERACQEADDTFYQNVTGSPLFVPKEIFPH